MFVLRTVVGESDSYAQANNEIFVVLEVTKQMLFLAIFVADYIL